MSSKAITETPDPEAPAGGWKTAREIAPSIMREDEPTVARWIGGIGLTCLLVGGAALALKQMNVNTRIGPFLGSLFFIAGLVGLLYHAARDTDLQIRRAYGFLGFVWLAAGIVVTVWPAKAGVGTLFLPYAYACFIMALLFLMPFARNETDPSWHQKTLLALGAVGVVAGLTGLVGANVSANWLQTGLLLSLLGLAYLWAFIALKGPADDVGHTAGTAMGVAGLLTVLVALIRATFPKLVAGLGVKQGADYLESTGLLLMVVGFLYVSVAVGLCSENRFVVLTRRELASFFYSPLAYFILFAFSVMAAVQFGSFIDDVIQAAKPPRPQPMMEPIIWPFIFSLIPVISLILVVPLLTMRLLSEEHRSSTMEVLMTAPVQETPVVLSKFVAVLLIFLLTWLPYGLFLVALRIEGGQPFDYRPIISFTIALLCSGAGFLAMGLFFSSLTRNQVAAGVLTAMGMIILMAVYFIKRNASPGSNWSLLLGYASFIDLWFTALQGKLALRDVMFYISSAVFWLFLTIKVLESRKWR
ncbi:MAG: ABC transporter permease [Gemmataceae bacterium]|nr:ABC transporter permease [Gemmataceae bacterium]